VSGLLDQTPLELRCPSCGQVLRTTFAAARRSPTLRCPKGHEVKVDASQFDRELRKVDRSFSEFERSLKRLGR
jgi:lysyl-tRNA synthetase class I